MSLRTLARNRVGRIFHVAWPVMKHVENSVRGATYAHQHGYHAIDLDLQMTSDGVIVVTHWARPMRKDRFYDRRHRIDPDTPIHHMTWRQVRRLRTRDGYRIQRVERLLHACARLGIVALLEPKGNRAFRLNWPWEYIATVADDLGCTVSVRVLHKNAGALAPAIRAGFEAWEI